NINKEFRVHFLMRKYLSKPQGSAIELLYWVKKEEHNKTQFTGNSQTFQFSNQANIETIKIMQSIENDYAQLELSLKFP
nr:hypothetical protein [Pseudobdellovibrionaceae bacterium]